MACQTITGLLVAASLLFQGCVSGPPEAEMGGATAPPSAESAGQVGDGSGVSRAASDATGGSGSLEGPSPAAEPGQAAEQNHVSGQGRTGELEATAASSNLLLQNQVLGLLKYRQSQH